MFEPKNDQPITDVKTGNVYGMNELHKAVILEDEQSFFAALNSKEININAQDIFGRTPLHYAYALLNRRFIVALVKAGADTKLVDNDGAKPFLNNDYTDVLVLLSLTSLCAMQRQKIKKEYKARYVRLELIIHE